MKAPAMLAILLVASVSVIVPSDPAAAQSQGPGWWDEDWPFRVIVEGQGTTHIPKVGQGTSDLLAYELTFQDALDRAGWPDSLDSPPDPESIVVVPYTSIGGGASPGDPVPHRLTDPVTRTGSCTNSTASTCMVVWEKQPGAKGYGIYWAPTGWGVDVPETGHAPQMLGNIMGHEAYFFIPSEAVAPVTVAVTPQPDCIEVVTETGGSSGIFGCGGTGQRCETDSQIVWCEVPSGTIRVFSSQPVAAIAYDDTPQSSPQAQVAVGTAGQASGELRTIVPGGASGLTLVAWAHDGSCTGGCSLGIQTGGGQGGAQSVQLGPSLPVTYEPASDDDPLPLILSASGERVHAAIRGDGYAYIQPKDDRGMRTILPVSGDLSVGTEVANQIDLNDLSRGQIIREDLDVQPPVKAIPLPEKTGTAEVVADAPAQVHLGNAEDRTGPLHQPVSGDQRIYVPDGANLIAVAPGLGEATQRSGLEAISGREPFVNVISLSSRDSREIVRGGDRPAVLDVEGRAPIGFVMSTPPPKDGSQQLVAQPLAVHHPAHVKLASTSYLAKAFDIRVEPENAFAGAGSVVSFNITVENLARSGAGGTPSLTLSLSPEPVGLAEELDPETTVGATQVQLPGTHGATKTVPFNMRVPDGVADVVLEVHIKAQVSGEERITGSAPARVSVVTIRDFDLTFEDGSDRQTQTAQPGGENTFGLVVRNTGTVPLDVKLTREKLGGEAFDACVQASGGTSCGQSTTLSGIEPGHTARASLVVTSPDKDTEDRTDLVVRGELAEGAGPVRAVDATVFLNVPVVAQLSPGTNGLALAPGDERTLSLDIENQGVQATGNLTIASPGGPVNATLIDPESGEQVTTLETLLGPRDTQAAIWEPTLRVAASEDAPPGLTTEVRLELTLQPTGGLPPFRTSATVPVRVLRVLATEPLETSPIPAGTPTDVSLPLTLDALKGSQIQLRLVQAPALWDITTPNNLTFDDQGRSVLGLTIAPPVGAPPGQNTLVLEVLDPLGPGGELEISVPVTQGGNAELTVADELEVALGDPVVLEVGIENTGNAPLRGSVALRDAPEGITVTSRPVGPLTPGNQTTVPVTLRATQAYNGTVTLGFDDDGRRAGNTTIDLTAQAAPISVGAVRAPSQAPEAGVLYPITVTAINDGPVPVRNLTVALQASGQTVAQSTLERLPAGARVPVTIEWVPDRGFETSELVLRLDPDGRLIQDQGDDQVSLEQTNDTPLPAPLLLLIVSLALPARLKSLWRLTTARERALIIGGILLILLILPLLFVPTLTLERAPATDPAPADVVDSDEDGVSDVAEITRYGTLPFPSDPNSTDSDQDGMGDGWEAEHARWDPTFRVWRPDPARADADQDPDRDGLSNIAEMRNGTDPHDPDTDQDGFSDGWEVRSGLDPTRPDDPEGDCDADGLSNQREFELGTLACQTDSDRDGIPDTAELDGAWTLDGREYTFEPTDPAKLSTSGAGPADGWLIFHDLDPHATDHATADPDDDDLSTADEWAATKAAGLIAPGTWADGLDPNAADSDGDRLTDGWEVRVGLDPLDPSDAGQDTDGDGLPNRLEEQAGTDPGNADTDGDGLDDGTEVSGWTITIKGEEVEVSSNPLIRDTDGDGLSDLDEQRGRLDDRDFPPTNPLSGDTDGDGLSDGDEIMALDPPATLDPTVEDTDGDGLLDGEEWDLWTKLAQRAEIDAEYANKLRSEISTSGQNLSALLAPGGDLDGDGEPNILDKNSDDPGGLPATEADGLTDGEEAFPPSRKGHILPKSDPSLRDSDGDGLPDGWEIRYTRFDAANSRWQLQPLKADSDGDGTPDGDEDMETGCFDDPEIRGDGPPWFDAPLPNLLELEQGTDPLACDTDEDGLPDGWELAAVRRMQSAGLNIQLNPLNVDSDGDGIIDGREVSPVPVPSDLLLYVEDSQCLDDGETATGKGVCLWRWAGDTPLSDQLSDLLGIVELRTPCQTAGTGCNVVRVQLNLTTEVDQRTDPATADTDGDGYPDAWEILHRFDPSDPTSPQGGDSDGDGLDTDEELEIGTSPSRADTDRGGLIDGVDIDPLDASDDKGDCDFDGIDDADEARGGLTLAGRPDTDGDGLVDATFNDDDCETGGGLRTPTLGSDVIAVPDPDQEGVVLGENKQGTDATRWDSDGDGLPDGWEVLYGLNPNSQNSPQSDNDGDGIQLRDEYQLGRPAWWDEAEHGAWWFGSNPTTASDRDLDKDGLDDALFDPEPLSTANDCSLPSTWELPAAWSASRCLAQAPSEADQESLIRGLRELAWDHVLTVDDPEPGRAGSDSTPRTTVRVTSVSHAPNTLDTGEPFDVTADVCVVQGGSCSTPSSSQQPLVGIYAVTRGPDVDPLPKDDPLLCVVPTGSGGQATGTCDLGPGTRELPDGGDDLVLALHKHGVLEPGGTWTVQPGDIQPGQSLRLAAWPLPTEAGGSLLVGETDPATKEVTPIGKAVIHLLDDPVLEAGRTDQLTVQLTDEAGHTLPGRPLEVAFDGGHASTKTTSDTGTVTIDTPAIDTSQPITVPLDTRFRTAGVLEGNQTTFQVPVRIPSTLNVTTSTGVAPGSLPVTATLTDENGTALDGRQLTATARLPSLAKPVTANGTTTADGTAALSLPLPANSNPGQAAVTVSFSGDDQAAPASWEGLADIQVRPELTLDTAEEVRVTDGVNVVIGLRLPSGDTVTPAPGEALDLTVKLGPLVTERTITSAPSGGRVVVSFPAGPDLPLGPQTLSASLDSGRFNPAVSNETEVAIITPVTAEVTPTVIGAGVDNQVTVEVRDAVGRPISGAEARATILNVTDNATVTDGTATLTLPLPLTAPRGDQILNLEINQTPQSLPLTEEVDVQISLGTQLEVPGNVTGSIRGYTLTGRLLTATGEPVTDQVVTLEALGTTDVVTGTGGRFEISAVPPEGAQSGTYPAKITFEGSDTLAPATKDIDLILRRPVNLTVDPPGPATIGETSQLTGTVESLGGPVEDGQVKLTFQNTTYEGQVRDGVFTIDYRVSSGSPSAASVTVRFPAQGPYASAKATTTLETVQAVELSASQRATDNGLTLIVQAATADGQPLAEQTVVARLPGGFVQLTTDKDGVARYHVAQGTLPEGSEVEFSYKGSDSLAPASTTLSVQSAQASVPGQPIGLAIVALILIIEAIILWRVLRRRKVLDRVLEAVEELEHRLMAGDEVRASILQAYHRIAAALAAVGFEEDAWETHREYLSGTFEDLSTDGRELGPFLDLVDEAQYSNVPMQPEDRTRALTLSRGLIENLQDTLRAGGSAA